MKKRLPLPGWNPPQRPVPSIPSGSEVVEGVAPEFRCPLAQPDLRRMPRGGVVVLARVLFLLCLWMARGVGHLWADDGSLDLVGVVRSTDGRVLTNANVFIYTAGPRVGAGTLCPSCYADCRKSARSAGDGHFTIPSVNGLLLFRVLVVAPGFEPAFFPRTDPRVGPLQAVLSPRTTNHLRERTILGRVVDAQGRPIPQAVVSVSTTQFGNTVSSQPPEGTDPLAITDDTGEFALGSAGAFDSMSLKIESPMKAPAFFEKVRPGRERRTFVSMVGASIVGRVVLAGRPVSSVVVMACGADRSMGSFVGSYSIATATDGQFVLTGLPPDHEYYVYGSMESLDRWGNLPLKKVRAGADGATLDLGDLALHPGHRLAGRVTLSDRDSLPEGTRLSVSREQAWDSRTVDLPPDGRFNMANLPPGETLTLWTRVAGYRDSATNVSLNSMNGGLFGRLNTDKTNLLYLLEPGESRLGEFDEDEYFSTIQSPLAGAESKRARLPVRVIEGQALDAVTGKPLPRFRVSAGKVGWATASPTGVQWMARRGTEGTNGRYSVELPKSTEFAVVQADAEGYRPARSEPLSPGQTHHVFRMTRGNGPAGVVLGLEGRPAAGVTVVHLSPGQRAVLPQQGALSLHDRSTGSEDETITDASGRFQFSPKFGTSEVWVVTDEGFARVAAARLTGTNVVQLERWASVRGRIVRERQGIADEAVELQLGRRFDANAPSVSFEGTTADESGRFRFSRVPPGEITLATQRKIDDSRIQGWTLAPQVTVLLKPGEDRQLEDVEKSENGRYPDGIDEYGRSVVPSKESFLPWLVPGVMMMGFLTATAVFRSRRTR